MKIVSTSKRQLGRKDDWKWVFMWRLFAVVKEKNHMIANRSNWSQLVYFNRVGKYLESMQDNQRSILNKVKVLWVNVVTDKKKERDFSVPRSMATHWLSLHYFLVLTLMSILQTTMVVPHSISQHREGISTSPLHFSLIPRLMWIGKIKMRWHRFTMLSMWPMQISQRFFYLITTLMWIEEIGRTWLHCTTLPVLVLLTLIPCYLLTLASTSI